METSFFNVTSFRRSLFQRLPGYRMGSLIIRPGQADREQFTRVK